MSEEFEEQGSSFDFARIPAIVRRRHVQFLLLLFTCWLIVWSSSWVLPVRYKSSTTILVQQSTMPKNYVVSNINDDLQERLQNIEQQILSRTRLLMIIDKLHLYQGSKRALTPDDKVQRMSRNIDVDLVRDPDNGDITAFKVSFSASDPRSAQQVTSELTNLFIDENKRVREQESENTTQFIQDQLAMARANLADQDAKVRAFQATHEGSLPTQQASNLAILSGLQSQLQNEQDALNTARQQRVYTQSLLDQYGSNPGAAKTATGAPTGVAALDDQLDTLRAKLADLSTRYTDRYPEVQEVKSEIAKTQRERDQMVASLKSNAANKDREPDSDSQTSADPTQSATVLQLRGQLKASELEISNREQTIAGLKSRINDYQGRLNGEPAVEQQLADLTRGYDQSKANFDDLLKKENDSQMATSMEHLQEGERFAVLDPPSLPGKPDFPNRLKMCEDGLGIGIVLGSLVVFGLEFFDDRMYGEKEIQNLLPVAVIAEVPEVVSPAEVQRGKKSIMLGWTLAGFVFSMILVGSAFSFLRN